MIRPITRRTVLAAGSFMALPKARAAQPWTCRILAGGFDGEMHHAGLHIKLDDGWKTYWRVPGDGGIPPQISVTGANVKAFAFDCPLPQRFEDQSGQSIGYKHEAVFPIRIAPMDLTLPVQAKVDAFLGVCEVVCIPAQFGGVVDSSAKPASLPDAPLLQHWQLKVPVLSNGKPVTAVSADGAALIVQLDAPVDDMFVEFLDDGGGFALPPRMTEQSARLEVHGVKPSDVLKGRQVRLTSVQNGAGLEQVMAIA